MSVRHRVVGLPDPLRLRHVKDTDLWYVTTDIPEGSRIEYSFEVTRDEHTESFLNDPLNPKLAHGPFGSSSVCAAAGYHVPDWTQHDPEARPGEVVERTITSKALRRQVTYQLYLPARFRPVVRYPLVVVHDGLDYLNYTSAKTVLDNLIHRAEIAEMVVAFISPQGDRLVEYANHAPHARFVARELVPELTAELPAGRQPGRPHPDGLVVRRGRVGVDGRALPRRLRLAAARVAVAGLHRHRPGARRRPGLRPGREVRQPLPRAAAPDHRPHLPDVRRCTSR